MIRWGAQARGRGLGVSPLLSPFPVPLLHCPHSLLPPRLHETQKFRRHSPQQQKKPVIRAAVGGQFFTSKNSGLCRVFVHFMYTFLSLPFFVSLETLSPPVSDGEMAAPAGPNIYVYCNFRAITLKGSVQAGETHPPHSDLAGQVSGLCSRSQLHPRGCMAGRPYSRVLSGRYLPCLSDLWGDQWHKRVWNCFMNFTRPSMSLLERLVFMVRKTWGRTSVHWPSPWRRCGVGPGTRN